MKEAKRAKIMTPVIFCNPGTLPASPLGRRGSLAAGNAEAADRQSSRKSNISIFNLLLSNNEILAAVPIETIRPFNPITPLRNRTARHLRGPWLSERRPKYGDSGSEYVEYRQKLALTE